MKKRKQTNILVYENDNSARRDIVNLIIRDKRARLVAAVESKSLLFKALEHAQCQPDVILIDLEYRKTPRPIQLITQLKVIRPDVPIICVSEYGDKDGDQIIKAIAAGAAGYIDKNDVNVMYVTAVLQALKTGFVYTNAIEKTLASRYPHLAIPEHRLETWRLHPDIKPFHYHAVHECLLYGLPAPLVVTQLTDINGDTILTKSTIDTYNRNIAQILESDDRFYDLTYLEAFRCQLNKRSEVAFHILIQPPSRSHPAFKRNAEPQLYPNYDMFRPRIKKK